MPTDYANFHDGQYAGESILENKWNLSTPLESTFDVHQTSFSYAYCENSKYQIEGETFEVKFSLSADYENTDADGYDFSFKISKVIQDQNEVVIDFSYSPDPRMF